MKQYGMNLSVMSSEDKKFILISRFYDTKSKEKQKIECKVVDRSFSEVWYKLIETDNMDKEVDVKSIDVDNAGNLYMLMEFEVGKVNMPMLYSYYWKTKSLKSGTFGPKEGENFGTRLNLLNGENAVIVVQEMDAAGKVTKYPFSKDKNLEGYALYFNYLARIEKDFYYSYCINIKGMLSVDTKNITFKVKY